MWTGIVSVKAILKMMDDRKIVCSEIQSSVAVGKGGVYLTAVLLSRLQYRIWEREWVGGQWLDGLNGWRLDSERERSEEDFVGIVWVVVVGGYTVHNWGLIEEVRVIIGLLWYVWTRVETIARVEWEEEGSGSDGCEEICGIKWGL